MTTLFPYQIHGAKWLAGIKHGLLADPMGLGKSAQAITACDDIDARTILVVCPASMRQVWRREFEKFSGKSRLIHVMGKGSSPLHNAVNIVSYDAAATRLHSALMTIKYDVGIFDEAHFLKSTSAKRTQAVYGKRAEPGLVHKCNRVWLLTGTPAPNNPIELYPMCRVLFGDGFKNKDGKVMDKYGFTNRFCTTTNNGFGIKITGGKNLPELKERLAPYVLRRRKEEVLKDLPPIRFDNLYLDSGKLALPAEEEKVLREALESPTPLRALEAAATHLATLRRALGLAKVDPLAEWLKDQLEGGMEKVVIFAHHRSVMERLALHLSRVSEFVQICGNTNATERDNAVQRFQNDPACRVFLGQLQAAGTGLTLTAASDLVFAEYSWVPAENDQAAMRIHRIGQENPVMIRYAVVANSLDEKIAAVVRKKSAVISQVFA